jgi:hypothetical protein
MDRWTEVKQYTPLPLRFDDLEEFTEEDVALQEKFVFEKTAKKIKERVMKMGITTCLVH